MKNFPYFIAKRFSFSSEGKRSTMRPGIKIATFGIAVGLAVMLVAFSVVVGFKNEVSNQIVGFGAHIQISSYDTGNSFEKQPVELSDNVLQKISSLKYVKKYEKIVTKPSIIKTENSFQGVVFKGVDSAFCWDFFQKNLIEGKIIDYRKPENKDKVLISKYLANTLDLKTGDSFNSYFFQNQARVRKFEIAGIYSTTYSDFDKMFVISNLQPIQILNQWDSAQFSTLEIMLTDFSELETTRNEIWDIVGNRFNDSGMLYNALTIKQLYPQIFNWLDMLDMNAWIILGLMLIVAGFNMISGLLILILERTQTIGVFKALGMRNSGIRKIFLFHALFFVVRGMFWGNIVGAGIVVFQYFTHLIRLNPEFYYVSFVPVSLNVSIWLMLNIGVFFASILFLILPSYIITQISPAKSIKFE
ncbi:MAG: ABC transporter permease [Prevotellaceae bacterium]|jgi:lipoprotein-releasing system permease protein|nr:ABC transporter permease [Prevotellaceae bacterium]